MKKFLRALAAMCAVSTAVVLAADVGSSADVAAVRAAAHQKNPSDHTFGVHVVGDYALTDWYGGEASGYAAFKRISGEHWKQIDWGGGATDPQLLAQKGIPVSIARQLCSGWGDSSPC
jgi:hypothetical protein